MAALRAAYDAFADCDLGTLTRTELLNLYDEYETLNCALPTQSQRMLTRLKVETTPRELGAKTWNEVLRTRWRLSSGDAGRRLAEAVDLQPQPTVTGELLDPKLPATAAAQAAGAITAEQVKILRETINNLPHWVDTTTRSQIEVELVRVAVGHGHKELKDAAALRLFLLDQDGPEPDDGTERARKRGVKMGAQGRDGMTPLTATLDPEAAAIWEVLFAKFAAPGMCNPADPEPCTSGTPTQAQIDNDDRTLAQRQHDAMIVVGRIAVTSDLGQLNGLPVSIIIRTTLQDLESRGIAITGGGTRLTIDDVDRLGGHAAYHLCVFDKATGSALNHFRAKRVATPAQRIMLIARDGGCTKPGCTVGAYGCQVHHAVDDWTDGGNTNVDENALACGGDNRMVGPGGYTTVINDHHECEWIAPEHLDNGQARVNAYHRPETLLTPTEDTDEVTPAPAEPVEAAPEIDVDADEPETEHAEPLSPWDDLDSPPLEPIPPVWVVDCGGDFDAVDLDSDDPFGEPAAFQPAVGYDRGRCLRRSTHPRTQRTRQPDGPAPPG